MSTTFEAMNRKRKSRKKVRLSITVSQDVIDSIHRLFEQEPDKTASQIVSEAVRFAEAVGIYKPVRRFENDVRVETGRPAKPLVKGVGTLEEKKEWIVMYGGEHDGINAKFMKYEVTPTGNVVRNPQVMPLKSMPSSQDEFRKMILGRFATVNQAESAFETQPTKAELAPVRMIGQKRKSE
jgi:hypothetical protein